MLSIGILGTGAIGSLMAYHWRNQQLWALARHASNTHISVLPQALGITEPWHIQLPQWQGQPLDWLVVCTKAADTLDALKSWQPLLAQVKNLLLIQNGMGQQQQVGDWLQALNLKLPLWVGMCTEGAFKHNDQVIYAGVGKTIIGPWPSQRIATLIQQKLAINAVINPLTALFKCRNGELVSQPHYQEQLLALCDEIAGLYQALGWPLQQPLRQQALQVAKATANNKSSTLQDLEAGRPTELAFISGFLLEQARTIGYPLPLSAKLYSDLS